MQTEDINEKIRIIIDEMISDISDSLKLGYRISGSSSNDDFLIVSVVQAIDNNDIYDSFINFVFENDELVIMSGKWVSESPKERYHNTLLDGVNVLYNLPLNQVQSIESESVVYSFRRSGEKKCFILPCWRIVYTDKQGNIKTAYFDAL